MILRRESTRLKAFLAVLFTMLLLKGWVMFSLVAREEGATCLAETVSAESAHLSGGEETDEGCCRDRVSGLISKIREENDMLVKKATSLEEKEKRLHGLCLWSIDSGILSSAHDCSEGGIAVALAECCLSGPKPMGASLALEGDGRPDALLFGESQSRIVVSLP